MKNIIFFGPPGAGKGTQAKLISDHIKVPHLSTGDILRSKISQKDSLANELRNIMSSGGLVSDAILNEIVLEKLNNTRNGFILDGYPRTLEQSDFLNNFLKNSSLEINYIFNIDIDFEILKERIINRSKEEDREDDNIDALQIRYSKYLDTTKPVSDAYKVNNSEIFYEINGIKQIEEITSEIIKILEK